MKDNKDFNIPQSLIDAVKKVVETDTVQEAKDPKEYGYEGDMAISQLKTIVRHAEHLMGMLKPETDLPEWVQSKITLAQDYIRTSHDYLMSETNESLHPNQKKLDVAKPKGKLTAADFEALRAGKKTQNEEVEQVDEAKLFHPGQEVTVHKVDQYGFQGRDDHPPSSGVEGHKVRITHYADTDRDRLGGKHGVEGEPGYRYQVVHGTMKSGPHKGKSFQFINHELKHSAKTNEEVEQVDELSKKTLGSYVKKAADDVSYHSFMAGDLSRKKDKESLSADKKSFSRQKGIEKAVDKMTKEEVEQVDERTLTPAETKKKEEIVKSMKKGTAGFKKRYGERWKEVMYATATSRAKKD